MNKVENFSFESKNDIVDFISGGWIPPSEAEVAKLLQEVGEPEIGGGDKAQLVPDAEKDQFIRVMNRVHKNRIKNRNGFFSLAALLFLLSLLRWKRK